MSDNTIDLSFVPNGHKGTGIVKAVSGAEPLHVDTGSILSATFRKRFADGLCKDRPGIERSWVDGELLRLASNLSPKAQHQDDKAVVDGDDLHIVRPERIIHPAVSGLAVAERTIVDGQPVGRWVLYVRWADGRRQRLDLPKYLDLPNKSRLWIHPEPSEPLLTATPGWSSAARRAWLNGAAAPNCADLFRRICERIAHFLDLPESKGPGVTATLALWTLLTYIYLAFDAVPYLYIGGPLASGKSRVFDILDRLSLRPFSSSNLTAACLFRTLHNQGGVLLMDEAERLQESTPDMADIKSMLLAGYRRGGKASRLEKVGDTFKTVEFDVYGPKAIACIASLPPTLASRCISLTMFRAGPASEKPRRRIDADPQAWQDLRDDLHALALEYGSVWLKLAQWTDVCPKMLGRDFELWQPLLALATWIESAGAAGLVEIVKSHALDTIDAGRDDQVPDADEIVLRYFAEKVMGAASFTPGDVLVAAQQYESGLFQKWTPRTVSNRLYQYGIDRPKSSHGRRVYNNISVSMLQKIQQHYRVDLGLALPAPPNTANADDNNQQNKGLQAGSAGCAGCEAERVYP